MTRVWLCFMKKLTGRLKVIYLVMMMRKNMIMMALNDILKGLCRSVSSL